MRRSRWLLSFAACCFACVEGQAELPLPKLPPPGAVHSPLPYRSVSFYGARADKQLIRRAVAMGFNGVTFQTDAGTISAVSDFAQRDRAEGYTDLAHALGMNVTLWVHELTEITPEMGPVSAANDALWTAIRDRYERVLGQIAPQIDGLVLTVTESQIWVTDPDTLNKLVEVVRDRCRAHGKSLIVRTFVWTPDQLRQVMTAVQSMPLDVIIMSKYVPQDWNLRSVDDPAIGATAPHEQIAEYDAAGEYFLTDKVANAMPGHLKSHFDYDLAHGIRGVNVRVDRGSASVLYEPSEVNLWALGALASGAVDSLDEIWNAWARDRYGAASAAAVIASLEHSTDVVQEALYVQRLSFGDTRSFPPPNGDSDAFANNWDVWKWDPFFIPMYQAALNGDPSFIAAVDAAKQRALALASQSLEAARIAATTLSANEAAILRQRIANNQLELAVRAPMMRGYLRYRRILVASDAGERARLASEIRGELAALRDLAGRSYPPFVSLDYLGRTWRVGGPDGIDWALVRGWADRMEALLATAAE